MFNECGVTVAMGNALPILKEIADYITNDNNHDGVADFLEKRILTKKWNGLEIDSLFLKPLIYILTSKYKYAIL